MEDFYDSMEDFYDSMEDFYDSMEVWLHKEQVTVAEVAQPLFTEQRQLYLRSCYLPKRSDCPLSSISKILYRIQAQSVAFSSIHPHLFVCRTASLGVRVASHELCELGTGRALLRSRLKSSSRDKSLSQSSCEATPWQIYKRPYFSFLMRSGCEVNHPLYRSPDRLVVPYWLPTWNHCNFQSRKRAGICFTASFRSDDLASWQVDKYLLPTKICCKCQHLQRSHYLSTSNCEVWSKPRKFYPIVQNATSPLLFTYLKVRITGRGL